MAMNALDAASYSEDVVEKIRAQSDIVDVIRSYIPVGRHNGDILAKCPFHDGTKYTLFISKERQMYQCIDCGEAGDVFTFVMKFLKVSLREAAEILAEKAGIELPLPEEDTTGKQEREAILSINRAAALFFVKQLYNKDGAAGLDYLRQRGITDALIRRFGIGYAGDSSDALYRHLKAKGFSNKDLELSGLFFRKNGHTFDKFQRRVICPIVTPDKNVVGFSGRTICGEDPKYRNSPSTLAFDKKTVLYGLNLMKNTERKELILCEGNMDVVMMNQAGFDNTIGCLGTALSKEHALILAKYTDTVHLMFDSDDAGRKAAQRALPILRAVGIKADVVHLEPYKDPDEFIRTEGAQELDQRILSAEDGYLFEIRTTYSAYDLHEPNAIQEMFEAFVGSLLGREDKVKVAYIEAMKQYIAHYDEISSGHYFSQRTSLDTGISICESNQMAEHPSEREATNSQHHPRVNTSWLLDGLDGLLSS